MPMPHRALLCAYILVAFLLVILVQDLTRSDISATEHWISHLSLGERGWVNIANLLVGGSAVVLLGTVIGQHADSSWPARWTYVAGVGLLLAGVFVIDAPPGTQYDDDITWHGQIHEVAGALTFLGLMATCLTSRRLMSRRWGLACAAVVAIAFIAASIMAGFNYSDTAADLPAGLAERAAMFVGIGWLVVMAFHLSSKSKTRSER
jgi:hypothetical protein